MSFILNTRDFFLMKTFLAIMLIGYSWLSNTVQSATIVRGAEYRVSGNHVFEAIPVSQSSTVRWWMHRTEINEITSLVNRYERVDSAVGISVTLPLFKKYQQHTIYTVFTEENGVVDSVTIQVFLANNVFRLIYEHTNNKNKPISLFIVVPFGQSPSTHVVFIMHGINRNAEDYIAPWRDFAIRNNFIAIAPQFSETYYPSTRSYHLGNMFTGKDGTGSLIPETQWTFSLVGEIFEWVRGKFALSDSLYDIWGHSAGAQFVHRMMLFKPQAKVRRALSANAGSYTVPDLQIHYPYGVQHPLLSITQNDLTRYSKKRLIIMRGTADTLRDSALPTDPGDEAQGRNRYERAGYFYDKGVAINRSIAWQLQDVPSVGHSHTGMAPAAQALLANVSSVGEHTADVVPSSFFLYQNYPNPFNPSTIITYSFSFPKAVFVTLKIFDMLGREVALLVNEYQQAGQYVETFHGTSLSSGVYFYQLKAGNYVDTKKLVLIK